jgi:hypothetical protein
MASSVGKNLVKTLQTFRAEGTRLSRRAASRGRVEAALRAAGIQEDELQELFGFGTGRAGGGGAKFKGFKTKLDKSKMPATKKAISSLVRDGDALYEKLEALDQMLKTARQEATDQDVGTAAETAVGQAQEFIERAVDALDDALHVATSVANMLR